MTEPVVGQPAGRTPVAIIGMGCLFPRAQGLREYWRLIRWSEDGITEVPTTHWSLEDYFHPESNGQDLTYCRRGAFLSAVDFDPMEFGIPPSSLEATDTAQLLGLVVAKAALEDAGYAADRAFDRSRASVILGVTGTLELVIPLGARLGHPHWRRAMREAGVPEATADSIVRRISEQYVSWQENSFPGLLGNVVAGRIANRLDLRGTNCVVDAACASSLSAIHMALMELDSGRADLVVSGGVDALNDIFMFMCFSKTQALSPTGDARPFSKDADGTVIGEGIGMAVLKRLPDAVRDGDRIYAVIRGVGSSSDGRSQSIYAPRMEGQAEALRQAYRVSGVDPATVQLVEAHGTGTKVGDVVEFNALKSVYRESSAEGTWCAVGSVKSQIGHTKAASGVAGIIKAALALHHKVLPATIKVSEPNPNLELDASPFYLNTETRPWLAEGSAPRRSSVSSFGFGGSNFHAVLEEFGASKGEVAWDGSVTIIALSAATRESLAAKIDEWRTFLGGQPNRAAVAHRACASRDAFRSADDHRLVVVAAADGDLDLAFARAGQRLGSTTDEALWDLPDVFYGDPSARGGLAFLFPGQASQYVGMGRDLACMFPEMFEAIAEADRLGDSPARLGSSIYPHPSFDEQVRSRRQAQLTRTEIAQPALGAVTLGMLRVLGRFGVRPDAVAGHSYGELTALWAAGCFDDDTLRHLSVVRGRVMAACGETGTMLAVRAPLSGIEAMLAETGVDAVLAHRNGPTQGVLSGSIEAIDAARRACASRGWPTTSLAVSGAFHSPRMRTARDGFRRALAEVTWARPQVPVFANRTGQTYPDDPAAIGDLLADQLTHPVDFVRVIESMCRSGVRYFVEVGPKSVLTGLVRSIANEKSEARIANSESVAGASSFDNRHSPFDIRSSPYPHVAMALDASGGRGSGIVDLARVLGRLAAAGQAVDLGAWEPNVPQPRRAELTIPLLGTNYRNGNAKVNASVGSKSLHAAVRLEDSVVAQGGTAASAETAVIGSSLETGESVRSGAATDGIAPAHGGSRSDGRVHAPEKPREIASGILAVVQEGLQAMQALQRQTAEAHLRFLEGQEQAQRTFQAVIEHQQRLVERTWGVAPPSPVPSVATPPMMPVSRTVPVPPHIAPAGTETGVSSGPSAANDHAAATPAVAKEATHAEPAAGAAAPSAPADPASYAPTEPTDGRQATVVSSTPGAAAELERTLLEVVAELTGYPIEMLNADMDLEADLGIDSIKRVEILAAVQGRLPGLEAVNSSYMGSLRTLRNIVDYMSHPNGDGDGAATAAPVVSTASSTEAVAEVAEHPSVERRVLRMIELPPIEPAGRLRIAPGREIWIVGDDVGLGGAIRNRLVSLGVPARVVPLAVETGGNGDARVGGVVLIADAECPVTTSPARHERRGSGTEKHPARDRVWHVGAESALKQTFLLAKRVGPLLCDAASKGGGACFVTVSRMDGAFGLIGGERDPIQGGLAGLTKTVAHEWPGVRAKALDVAADWSDVDAIASGIVDELSAAGPIEVGLDAGVRRGLQLVAEPAVGRDWTYDPGDVVVISGGARGVTAEVACALAGRGGPTLVLLGRSPAPQPEPSWLHGLNGEAEIKRALIENAFGSSTGQGARVAPAEVEAAYRRCLADREIRRTRQRCEQAGATVLYRSVDVRDAEAVSAVIAEVREQFGPIRSLIHGAGVIEDRWIGDKDLAAFERVFDTKVAGLRNLLSTVGDDPLSHLVLFSSVSGRFGRQGQVDYAMANEVLNKVAQMEARRRPTCRVVSINWGPWDGGMVTAAHKKEFARLGIGLVPPDAGAASLLAELSHDGGDVEVTLGGSWPESLVAGSVSAADRASDAAPVPTFDIQPAQPVRRNHVGAGHAATVGFKRTLDIDRHPFLRSHVIGGHPVLPVAVMLEWLGHAALHDHPGLVLHGFEEFRVLKGVILNDGPSDLRAAASRARRHGAQFEVDVELRSGEGCGTQTRHARARALLGSSWPAAPVFHPVARTDYRPYERGVDGAYRDVLFHGPAFQGIERIDGYSSKGMTAALRAAGRPADWMGDPVRSAWLADPLVLDAGLQLGILWCHEERNALSLPTFGARYAQFRPSFPTEGVTAVLEVREASGSQLVADVTFLDAAGVVVARMEGFEWTVHASLSGAFRAEAVADARPAC